jgi:uncharacterized protein
VILIDANLLLYAYDSGSPQYRSARAWLEEKFAGDERIGLGWTAILAFLRVGTSRSVLGKPHSTAHAAAIVSDWLAKTNLDILSPTTRHWPILADLLHKAQARSALIMDAHLAALAIEHGATLCTNDRDFARFPGLKLQFPLQA